MRSRRYAAPRPQYQCLAETHAIRCAQDQGGREGGEHDSRAIDDQFAPLQAFRQSVSHNDQKNRPGHRDGCEHAIKEVTVMFAERSHINLLTALTMKAREA